MHYVTGTGGRGRGEDGPISSLPLEIHQDLYNSLEELVGTRLYVDHFKDFISTLLLCSCFISCNPTPFP